MKNQDSQSKVKQNGVITTIYFDGQFYCALIEKYYDTDYFVGRYVFGKEPSNPELINWMINDFSFVPLLQESIKNAPNVRFKKKMLRTKYDKKSSVPKSLTIFNSLKKEKKRKNNKSDIKKCTQKLKTI